METLDAQALGVLAEPMQFVAGIFAIFLPGFLIGMLVAHRLAEFRLERTPFLVGLLVTELLVLVILAFGLLWPAAIASGQFFAILMAQAVAFGLDSILLGLLAGARGRDGFRAVAAGFLMLVPLLFFWLMFRAPREPVTPAQGAVRQRVSGERGILLIIVLLTLNFIGELWLEKRFSLLDWQLTSQPAEPPVLEPVRLTDAERVALIADLQALAAGFVTPFDLSDQFTLDRVTSIDTVAMFDLRARYPYLERPGDKAFFATLVCEDEHLLPLLSRRAQALVTIHDPDGTAMQYFGYTAATCASQDFE